MANAPRIAIFGSTGGSGLAALRECLASGHDVTALVRSKDKLIQLLQQNNDTKDELPSNLTIVQGDIRDVEKVKEVIEGRDVIVSAIGMLLFTSIPFIY